MEAAVTGSTLEFQMSSGERHVVRLKGGHPTAESAFAAALPIASSLGEPLRIPRCSSTLVKAAGGIMSVYEEWDWGRVVPIDTAARDDTDSKPAEGIGAFFSAGVDSTFTVLQHPEVTHLIHVVGFDGPRHNDQLRSKLHRHVRAAADHLGKELLVIETDIREFSDGYLGWMRYHGPAMAFVAHSLRSILGKVFIPSTHIEGHQYPWGSHARLDHRWSTPDMTFVYEGSEFSRPEKIAHVGRHPETLKWLRVCFNNAETAYNCGRCEKCLRTMVTLELLGLEAPTFPPLEVSLLRNLRFLRPGRLRYWTDILEVAEGSDRPDIAKEIRHSVRMSRISTRFPQLGRVKRRILHTVNRSS